MGKFLPALQLLGIGWYFATCIVFGVVGGRWLDGQLGTDPALTLVGRRARLGRRGLGWISHAEAGAPPPPPSLAAGAEHGGYLGVLTRRKGILLGAFVVIIVGLAFIKLPTPTIVLAAEDVVDLGGYTITNTILSTWIVIILMAIGTLLLYRRIRHVEAALVPSGFQNVVEMLLEWFFGMVRQVAGERGRPPLLPGGRLDLPLPARGQLVRPVPLEQHPRQYGGCPRLLPGGTGRGRRGLRRGSGRGAVQRQRRLRRRS